MSDCTDRRFEEMLHAYELGMLSEDDQRQFEVHLIECPHCFEAAQKGKDLAKLLHYDTDFKEMAHRLTEQKIPADAVRGERSLWRKIIPTSLAAVVVLIILILKPWDIQIRPDLKAYADNRLTIMYFDNLADPEDSKKLGEIATNLLITDLSESNYLQVLSSQRLYDIIQLLKLEGVPRVSKDIASKVAEKADAKWILTGNILQEQPSIIVTAQLADVATGNAIASQRIAGEPGENIFSIVDKLTVAVKQDLTLPSGAQSEPDFRVAEVTTDSPEAYRYYLEGVEYYQKYYNIEALRSFEKALEYDSTFAMVYYYLAGLKDRNLIYKAKEFSENASLIDRYYIDINVASVEGDESRYIELLHELLDRYPEEKDAYFLLGFRDYADGRYQEAADNFSKIAELDPLSRRASNLLAYTYNKMGDLDKAIEAINKYIELAPGEANPYDSRGDIYSENGKLHEAIESYKMALSIKPDFYASLSKLALLYLFENEFDKADSCLDALFKIDNEDARTTANLCKIDALMRQGKFKQAQKTIDTAIILSKDIYPSYRFKKAQIYWELEDWDSALAEIEKCLEIHRQSNPQDSLTFQYVYIHILADSKDFEAAQKQLESFRSYLARSGKSEKFYWFAAGAVEFAKGNYNDAAAFFDRVREAGPEAYDRFMIGRSYLSVGRHDEAIVEFERLLGDYSSSWAYWPLWSVNLHYYLGLAFDSTGQYDKAIDEFEKFLDIRKNADYKGKYIEDAETRLNRLKTRL